MKKLLKKMISGIGYKITKLKNNPLHDSDDPFEGIRYLMGKQNVPIISFDIGANIGQTIEKLIIYFPNSNIYAFEPGSAYNQLYNKYKNQSGIVLENKAVGAHTGERTFFENEFSDMSSFLPLGESGWGKVVQKRVLTIKSVDDYCSENNISYINILKTDTQGFDLEVLTGAINMLKNTQFVLVEINFFEIYKDLPSFHEIFSLLIENGLKLVRFYDQQYSNNFISHADALFINPNFKQRINL